MGRGGARPGSGRPGEFKTGKTKTIRVPERLAEQIVYLTHVLDEGKPFPVDIRGIKLYKLHGRPVVRLKDLMEHNDIII